MGDAVYDLAIAYGKAWAEGDADAAAALHTEDSVLHLHGAAPPIVGRAGIAQAYAAFLADSPDLRFELTRAHVGDGHFTSEYMMTGTRDGKPYACAGSDIFTVRDGLVARKDSYIDWLAYGRQTGVYPDAEADPAA